jgi:hypothetical protein
MSTQTRKRNRLYQDRDALASWCVSIWQDAIAFKYTQAQVLAQLGRVWNDRRWKRIPQYQHEYITGYERSYKTFVVDRQFLECGAWVSMPDGSVQWFGVKERVKKNDAVITYRYIYEHAVPERSGIYWVEDEKRGVVAGMRPFFIPALDFHPVEKTEVPA